MRSPPPAPLLLAMLAAAAAWLPARAAAQATIHRCVDADGRTVYTDRRCSELGAVERLPALTGDAGYGVAVPTRLYHGGCPRTLGALVHEIGAAVLANDVNRLSSVYDWTGVGKRSASRILDRLEAMVARPLVDIAPVLPEVEPYAEAAPPPPPPTGTAVAAAAATAPPQAAWMPSWADRLAAPPAPQPAPVPVAASPAPVPAAPPRRPRPVGLRVEQTLADSATPTRTVFGLRRHFGCFWITF